MLLENCKDYDVHLRIENINQEVIELNNLVTIKSLTIENSGVLKYIYMDNLKEIKKDLNIINNENLTRVVFDNMEKIRNDFKIINNENLISVKFKNMKNIGNDLKIINNKNLISVMFKNSENIGYDLEINNNENLIRVKFKNMKNIINDLKIINNENLISVMFEKLESIGYDLNVSNNTNLKSINIESLELVANRFAINDVKDSIDAYLNCRIMVDGWSYISQKFYALDKNCKTPDNDNAGFQKTRGYYLNNNDFKCNGNNKCVGDINLSYKNQFKIIKECEFYNGKVTADKYEGTELFWDKLIRAQELRFTNTNLTQISFKKLEFAVDLEFCDNMKLTKIQTPKLKSIESNLKIKNNPKLRYIETKELEKIDGDMSVINNSKLANISMPLLETVRNVNFANNNNLSLVNFKYILRIMEDLHFPAPAISHNNNQKQIKFQYPLMFKLNSEYLIKENFNKINCVQKKSFFISNYCPYIYNKVCDYNLIVRDYTEFGVIKDCEIYNGNLTFTNYENITIVWDKLKIFNGSLHLYNNTNLKSINLKSLQSIDSIYFLDHLESIRLPKLTNITSQIRLGTKESIKTFQMKSEINFKDNKYKQIHQNQKCVHGNNLTLINRVYCKEDGIVNCYGDTVC